MSVRRRRLATAGLLLLAFLSGCARIGAEPWERDILARPEMQLDPHPVLTALDSHMYFSVVDLSYRYLWDDWGIRSHTVELQAHTPFGARRFLEPSVRFYRQTKADFCTRSLLSGAPLPDYVSADYRLGDFDTVTLALLYGESRNGTSTLNVRFGYYLEMGDSSCPRRSGCRGDSTCFRTSVPSSGRSTLGSTSRSRRHARIQRSTPPGAVARNNRPPSLNRAGGHWVGAFRAMASPCELLVEVEDRRTAWELAEIAYREAL